MIKKVAIGFTVLVLAFFLKIYFQSPEFKIERSIVIKATPEKIFPHIVDSKKADEWMPWYELDKQAKVKYSEKTEGVGASSSWESPGEMGVGRSEIVEVIPNKQVSTQLIYTKPMVMNQMVYFKLFPEKEGTKISWSVVGENNFIGRLFCTFIDMDKNVGDKFILGLEKLKKVVESEK